ncbi:MAG: hypothetical protein OXQ84_12735 [bacterium]|nr:hypothetical protein [bacterium]
MSHYFRKWLNRPNALSLVGGLLIILSILALPGPTAQVSPVELEITVEKSDEIPLWVTVSLYPDNLSYVRMVFPEGSGYSVLVNRMPRNITSNYASSNYDPPHTVSTKRASGYLWSFSEEAPSSQYRRRVTFQLEDFVTPTNTGHVGIWRLKVRSGFEELFVSPAFYASYNLVLSASIPNPAKITTTRRDFEEQEVTMLEGFDIQSSEEPRVLYTYETVKGEFLAKWELLDTQRARDREFWLIFWSSLLGLGIGFILEGFIVRI